MADTSQHNFKLGEMADDLYDYTLELCGKQEDKGKDKEGKDKKKKTYRFPLYTYPNYVSRILETAGDIHRDIFIANESHDFAKRIRLEDDAVGKCIYLNHLTHMARDRGWISNKQLDRWRRLTNAVYWSTINWMKSDMDRMK